MCVCITYVYVCVCVCVGCVRVCACAGESLQFRNCVIFVRFCEEICRFQFRMLDKQIAAFIYRSGDLTEISLASLIWPVSQLNV